MKVYPFFILLLILGFNSNNTYAQCCAAGTPNCDNGLANGSGKHVLSLSLGHQYSYSDQYYQGTTLFESNYIKNSFFHFGSLRASYGVTEKLKLVLDLGHFYSKAQTLEQSNYFREAKGLADVGISGLYTLYNKNNLQLAPIFRLTLPFGQFDQKFGPVILPIDLQPSAGSLKSSAGLYSAYKLKDNWSLALLGTYEISNKIETEHTSYKYGGLTNLRLIANHKFNKSISAGLHVWYQNRERAEDQFKELINATGGQLLFVCPTAAYNYKDWRLSARYELPVYKNMNGTQLTNNHRIAVRLTRSINLDKDRIIDSLNLNVSGVCGMCKTRIETAALLNPKVVTANYDLGTKILNIKVSTDFNKNTLIESLLAAGHDTENQKATEEAYDALHFCCKYRE